MDRQKDPCMGMENVREADDLYGQKLVVRKLFVELNLRSTRDHPDRL